MSKRLWWFLLVNNIVILLLFIRKMKIDGDLVFGYGMNFHDWQIHAPSSNVLVGALPFVFSFGFILYKIITHPGEAEMLPEILDQDSPPQRIEDFIK
jgi:hypothetical protein